MGYAVARLPLGWAVKNADRARISPVLPTEREAIAWAERHGNRRAKANRTCLTCKTAFESEGIHDRLCTRCGTIANDAGLNDVSPRDSLRAGRRAR